MNARNRLLLKGGVAIVALWIAVGVVTRLAGSMKPTPEKIEKYVLNHPLDDIKDPEERRQMITRLAEMMNQLEPEDMRKLEEKATRESRRALFSSMTPEEQWFFMEKRMGRAFTQMMESFNQMEREERKKMVEQSLKQMRKNEGDRPMDDATPEMVEKIASAGMKSYFEDASAETKLDLAPLMEELQKTMSSLRGHGRGKQK